ncbi:MAG: GDYXXLXY domain-containing protein [Alphaproteobacteria bacterium]
MNAKRYRERVAADLERWIANGWVPEASREPILADLPKDAPGRTSLWLGMIGVTLAGLAIIAGIADNWAIIPRILKLALLLALMWAAIGGALWANGREKSNTVNALVMLAALIFAASVGLLGQALNIPGDPDSALVVAAVGAGLLALAGSSIAAGVVYLALVALHYWADTLFATWGEFSPSSNLEFAVFLGGGLVLGAALRSRLMLHGTLLLAGALILNTAWRFLPVDHDAYAYVAAGVWAVLGAAGLIGAIANRAGSGILLGWSAWHGLLAFALTGIETKDDLVHRHSVDRGFGGRYRARRAPTAELGARGRRHQPHRRVFCRAPRSRARAQRGGSRVRRGGTHRARRRLPRAAPVGGRLMRKFLPLRLFVAGFLLSAGLVAAAVMHISAVASGSEVVIPAQAFDPRAFLTGHYAQLRYAISQAEAPTLAGIAPKPGWQPVWVAIAPSENDWKAVSVTANKPAAAPEGGRLLRAEARVRAGSPADLRYGIERIYAQQSEAEAIDRAVRVIGEGADARLKVVASLGGDGRLRVKGIIMGGQRTDFGWW